MLTQSNKEPSVKSSQRLSDVVYKNLYNEIIEGHYPPGAKLREQEISKRMGISRTPVREALNRLIVDGLLQSVPNSGVHVKMLTSQDLEDLYALRASLESLAVRLACERGFPESKLIPVRKARDKFNEFLVKKDMKALHEADLKFHIGLISLANSRIISDAFSKNHVHIISWKRTSIEAESFSWQKLIAEEHQEIVDALEKRDGEKASKACERHIHAACLRVLEGIELSGEMEFSLHNKLVGIL